MHNYSQDDQTAEDKRKKGNDIQREIIMSESDLHKVISKKAIIEAELSHLKKNIDHLRSDMQEKQHQFQGVEQEIMMRQTAISQLKKKLNLI